MQQINDLIDGFGRYSAKYSGSPAVRDLKQSQQPRFLVIACSDSRTDPAILFDASPGDLLVVRNVANLVPPYEVDHTLHGVSAALEFGVKVLKVRHVVVLGHSHCAGIHALVTGPEGEFVTRWMQIAAPAYQRAVTKLPGATIPELCHKCEQEAIADSVNNLMSFPWVLHRVVAGDLFVHGWYFDLDTGTLFQHEPHSNQFVSIPPTGVPDPTIRNGRGLRNPPRGENPALTAKAK